MWIVTSGQPCTPYVIKVSLSKFRSYYYNYVNHIGKFGHLLNKLLVLSVTLSQSVSNEFPLCTQYKIFFFRCTNTVSFLGNTSMKHAHTLRKLYLWDMVLCSLLERLQCFGGTCYLYFCQEDGGSRLIRNIGTYLSHYIVSLSRRVTCHCMNFKSLMFQVSPT